MKKTVFSVVLPFLPLTFLCACSNGGSTSSSLGTLSSSSKISSSLPRVDENHLYYGEYPQSKVPDGIIKDMLDTLTEKDEQGYYVLGGEKYVKFTCVNQYASESHPNHQDQYFLDGTKVEYGVSYWFRVEPILWRILSGEEGNLFVTSEYLLDQRRFGSEDPELIGGGFYEASEIRAWLNGEFLDQAFHYDSSKILTTELVLPFDEEGLDTTTLRDKVFLLSQEESKSPELGFGTKEDRIGHITDYAVARGAVRYTEYNSGYWWTRLNREYKIGTENLPYYLSYFVDIGGSFDLGGPVWGDFIGARPAMHLSVD